jgi:anti-sigma factor RsiW
MTDTAELDDDSVAAISDFVEGSLTGPRRDEVANKIESDPAWKQTHDEMVEAKKFAAETLSGVQKRRAPDTFAQDVTSTIHKRSAGRFFGRRTLGDKMPFGVLVIIAVLGIAVIGYLMWASETGSLKPQHDRVEKPHDEGKLVP